MEILKSAGLSIWDAVGFKLIAAFLILAVGMKAAGWIAKRIASGRGFKKLDESVQTFLASFLRALLYVMVVITAAYVLGIPMTSFITVLASAGVAIGLALQGALSNFAGGIMILIFKPFEVGDYIEASGYGGSVAAITVFYTVLVTPDKKRVTLPNGSLTGEAIVNYSSEPRRRVDITFDVGYEADVNAVEALVMSKVAADERVLSEPEPPFVRMTAMRESSLEFTLRVYCESALYWQLKYDLTAAVKNALDEEGIPIPYQQIDVHMK